MTKGKKLDWKEIFISALVVYGTSMAGAIVNVDI